MRILYHSAAPWANTGYGRCTREIATRLQNEGFDVAIQCLSSIRKGPILWNGEIKNEDGEWETPIHPDSPIPVYSSSTTFGLGDVVEHYNDFGADLYHTHFDTWMGPARDNIPEWGIPYTSYVIVDHYPAPDAVVQQVSNSERTIAMSKYAQRALQEKGIRPLQIPHGVHTDKYYPMENESDGGPSRIQVQDDHGNTREIDLGDTFLFGMVAANHGDRKHIPGHLEAFKMFLEQVDSDALLYCHTEQNSPQGHNLEKVRRDIGIPKQNLIWPSPDDYHNIGDDVLNAWYNAFDVMLNCSYGESWGLTITEAQAAGTPCIVTNFSSMPEQLGAKVVKPIGQRDMNDRIKSSVLDVINSNVFKAPHGVMVEPSMGVYREKVAAKQYICDPRDIFRAMNFYYENRDEMEKDGEKAHEFVNDNYDWDKHVIPQFVSMFDRISETL